MSDGSAPAPPDGYRRYDPEEEMGWSRSDFFEIVGVLWPISLLLLMGVSYTSAVIGRFFNILVLGIVAMAIHEAIHIVAGRLFGLEVTVGINFKYLSPYVLTHGGFQSRLQTAIISAAPLVVFTTFCFITFFIVSSFGRPAIDIATLGLMNIVLAYYDLLDLRFTLNLPEGTKEYHREGHDITYYVPEEVDPSE